MVLRYFKEYDFSKLSGATILLDYGGTIKPATGTDPESEAAVKALASRNKVYICSGNKPDEVYAQSLNASWLLLDKPKPFVGKTLSDLLKTAALPVIVIGDSQYIDGILAKRLDAPFIHVKSLYSNFLLSLRNRIMRLKSESYSALPAFLRNAADEPITVVTSAPGEDTNNKAEDLYLTELLSGLTRAGAKVLFNPPLHLMSATVCAVGSVSALRFALERKKRGFVSTVIAGPDIVLHPNEGRELIEDPAVNAVVVGAPWLKEWWTSSDQYFNRSEVVSLGVADRGVRAPEAAQTGNCIIYASDAPENVFRSIVAAAWQHQLPIVVSQKGNFTVAQYQKLLKNARLVIYVASHDSTGVILKQAWMADVPTLCYQPESFEYRGEIARVSSIGAPFLTNECGMSFSSALDFDPTLKTFLEKLSTFTPRKYALDAFSLERGATNYLQIIHSAQQQ